MDGFADCPHGIREFDLRGNIMKRLSVAALSAFLFIVPLTQVHADSHEQNASQEKWGHYVEQWQGRMNTMHKQMDRIHQTKDPKERQRLLEEHWKTMDEQMAGMRDMEGMMGGMMGGMHGQRGDRGHGSMHMMDPDQRDTYMQDRMDMQQMMMEQMMQHNHMMMREGMH
ncbi:MAG: hypothetical protein QNM00_11195 [Gammaproteobacteria bacterium]|nr:hypothetical protein [Gammaproteobacteria bacterium]